jgi:hypothetical protein
VHIVLHPAGQQSALFSRLATSVGAPFSYLVQITGNSYLTLFASDSGSTRTPILLPFLLSLSVGRAQFTASRFLPEATSLFDLSRESTFPLSFPAADGDLASHQILLRFFLGSYTRSRAASVPGRRFVIWNFVLLPFLLLEFIAVHGGYRCEYFFHRLFSIFVLVCCM